MTSDSFRFRGPDGAEWRAEPARNVVARRQDDGTWSETTLEPRVMGVLGALASAEGAVVSREALMEAVWGDTVVNEEVLTRAVSQIRQAVGDRASDPRVVETVRGTGYRWVAPEVERPSPAEAPAGTSADVHPTQQLPRSWIAVGAALLLAGGVAVWAVAVGSDRGGPGDGPMLEPAPFTSYPGVELQPAVAPDGERVAFVWHRPGTPEDSADLYLKQPGAEEPLRLTHRAGLEGDPTWSPDGSRIAFLREVEGGSTLHTIPAIGGTERTLLRTDAPWFGGVDWTPDGSALIVADRPAPEAPYRLVRVDLSTRSTNPLTTPPATAFGDLDPAVSPDGRSVAFLRRARGRTERLYRTSARQAGTPKLLSTGWLRVNGFDWTLDGAALVLGGTRAGDDERLFRVDAADGRASPLPLRRANTRFPSLAGGTLVFQATRADEDIYRLPLPPPDTLATGRSFLASTREDDKPAFAPNGDQVAFSSARSGADQLWRADARGQSLVQLTTLARTYVGASRWAPDGRRIAFTADSAGARRAFVVGAEGGPVRPVPFEGGGVSVEDWHCTGLYVASDRSGQWQIWRIPPAALPGARSAADSTGAGAEQVTTTGGTRAQVDPRGGALFVVRPDTTGLWRLPLQGGPATQVVTDPGLATWTPWTVTNDAILYAAQRAEGAAVVRVDRRTGTRTPLTQLPVVGSTWAVAPDGQALLYTRLRDVQSDLYRIRWSAIRGE